MKQNTHIFGKHAVREALVYAEATVESIFLASGGDTVELAKIAKQKNIPIHTFDPRTPPKGIPGDAAHQGVIADVNPDKLMRDYKTFVQELEVTPSTSLIVLGELQDPQNVGAVIRSATAFGVSGVIIPEHRQAPVTGAAIKVSAGMAFRVPLITVKNVNTTLRDLKERGFWVYGLAGEAEQSLTDERFDRASVFVVGNEGDGLREMTAKECDVLLRIPMDARCESLNASVSAGVVLYEWQRQALASS